MLTARFSKRYKTEGVIQALNVIMVMDVVLPLSNSDGLQGRGQASLRLPTLAWNAGVGSYGYIVIHTYNGVETYSAHVQVQS